MQFAKNIKVLRVSRTGCDKYCMQPCFLLLCWFFFSLLCESFTVASDLLDSVWCQHILQRGYSGLLLLYFQSSHNLLSIFCQIQLFEELKGIFHILNHLPAILEWWCNTVICVLQKNVLASTKKSILWIIYKVNAKLPPYEQHSSELSL